MAGYIGSRASVVSSGAERKKTFDITTTTTVLTGLAYTPTFVHLFHNGVRLVDGTDYTATNGTSITLTTAAQSGDQVVVVSYATFQAADAYTKAEADAGFVSDPNGVVTVDGSGNVGIGTAVPSEKLSIVGAGNGTSFSNTTASTAYNWATVVGNAGGSVKIGVDNNIGTAFNSGNYGGSIQSTNNLAFSAGGTERMRIDAAGRVTTPSQPAFYGAYTGVNVAWANNQTFGWNIVHMNVGNHFNGGTGLFTAPVAGVYSFNYNAFASSGPTQVCLKINGSDWRPTGADTQGVANLAPIDGQRTGGATLVIPLAAGDYVHVGMRTGFADTIYMGHSHFSGYLIG